MKVQALIDQVLDEAMRLGQKPHGAYKSYWTVITRSPHSSGKRDWRATPLKLSRSTLIGKQRSTRPERSNANGILCLQRRRGGSLISRAPALTSEMYPKGDHGTNWMLTTQGLRMNSLPAVIFTRTQWATWSGW